MIIILLSFSSCHAPDEVVVMHVLPLAPAVSHKGGRLGYIISCEGSVDRLSGGVVCAIYIYVYVAVGWGWRLLSMLLRMTFMLWSWSSYVCIGMCLFCVFSY